MIRIGQKLTIPIPGVNMASIPISKMPGFNKVTYKVRKGDTLGHIAEDYGTQASNIRKWNGIKYVQHSDAGQKLTIRLKQG
jgi:membrane-bound lytic murein transglycosylase D